MRRLAYSCTLLVLCATQAGAVCNERTPDASVLVRVFSELVAPQLKPGPVLFSPHGVSPRFPATTRKAAAFQDCVRKEEAERCFDFLSAIGLDYGEDHRVPREMVEASFARVDCPLPGFEI